MSHVKIIVRRASRWRIFIDLMYSRRRCVGYSVLWVPISHCIKLSCSFQLWILLSQCLSVLRKITEEKTFTTPTTAGTDALPKVSPLWVANTFIKWDYISLTSVVVHFWFFLFFAIIRLLLSFCMSPDRVGAGTIFGTKDKRHQRRTWKSNANYLFCYYQTAKNTIFNAFLQRFE